MMFNKEYIKERFTTFFNYIMNITLNDIVNNIYYYKKIILNTSLNNIR
jgi:hypothetical protein